MSHLSPVPSDPEGLREWLVQRREADVDLGFEWSNPAAELPPAPDEIRGLAVRVELQGTEPAVWRRLVVPGDTTLDRLHDVLQTAMGWTDSHLHRFFSSTGPGATYFVTHADLDEGEEGTPENQVRLDQLLRDAGDAVLYEYDFGDGWDHELRLEEIGAPEPDRRFRCTDGAGACPPEDVGGVGGYAEVASWVRSGRRADDVPPQFESYDHADSWLPRDWDPDAFDLDATNERLGALTVSEEALERLQPTALEAVQRLSPRWQATVSSWAMSAAGSTLSARDLDDLASPYRLLLEAIGDGVQLTAAGYLPADLVRALCPALRIDPILAGKANRESNIRPLLMFRAAAERSGLLHRSGRRLEPTADAHDVQEDAEAMWRHISARLPYGDDELASEIGWFTLLAVAGSVERYDVFTAVHELCIDAGWTYEGGGTIARQSVNELVWPTLAALIGPRWNSLEPWPSWVPAAAASVVFAQQSG